uniref:Uncharacterized protein n=1 Tax=Cacopsylla melanoneura TaxID=428564 RepID=A0A8D8M4Y1_9HEMI
MSSPVLYLSMPPPPPPPPLFTTSPSLASNSSRLPSALPKVLPPSPGIEMFKYSCEDSVLSSPGDSRTRFRLALRPPRPSRDGVLVAGEDLNAAIPEFRDVISDFMSRNFSRI